VSCSVLDEAQTRGVTESDNGVTSGPDSRRRSSSSGVTRASSTWRDDEGEDGDGTDEGGEGFTSASASPSF
jgi:hypothetical protein